jgi:hypothetical protein
MSAVPSSVFASGLVEAKIADVACTSDDLDSIRLPVASLVIRYSRNIEGVARYTDETKVMATDRARTVAIN